MDRRTATPPAPVRPVSEGAAASRPQLVRWDELALERVTEMVQRKVVHGAAQTMAQVWLKRGALVARHRHASEQMTFVFDGALRLMIAGESPMTIRAGEVVTIPANLPHQIEVLEDSLVIETFSPGRTDW